MTEMLLLHSPPHQVPSSSSSITSTSTTIITPTNNDVLHQQTFDCNINSDTVALYRRNCTQIHHQVVDEEDGNEEEISVLAVLVTIFRKSLVGCKNISGVQVEDHLMDIGSPTNVRHVAHVTFDRFNGFLGLPVEFEPEVPRRPPSASTRVFGVSTDSMQLSFDSRGNCVPTILLMMQRRLYSQGGLQSEGIFRINPENGQEEYVREQLNNGLIPDNIDVHCLAGLIKAWFRELPRGILDSLSSEQVMEAQSEDECAHLVKLLPPTEGALLDWAINLMADVAQLEHLNKMNARNIAMVFAPNMTQMSDPLTALMYAVQVMNFLKTLIVKTLRHREDSIVEPDPKVQLEPSDEDGGHQSILKPTNLDDNEPSGDEEPQSNYSIDSTSQAEPKVGDVTQGLLSSIENILPDDKGNTADDCPRFISNSIDGPEGGKTQPNIRRTKSGQPSNSGNNVKKGTRKHTNRPPVHHVKESTERSKEISMISNVNSYTERVEAWR